MEEEVKLSEVDILELLKDDYIGIGNISDQLRLSYYGKMLLKLVKRNDELSNSQVLLMEVLKTPQNFNDSHYQHIRQYYEQMSRLSNSPDF